MRKTIFYFLALVLASSVQAAAEVELKSIKIDLRDKTKLQRGAKMFMNYCSGCHALRHMRYNHMAKDLGLTTFDGQIDSDLLKNNLIFTAATVYDPIQISMPEEDARQWFGRLPPDLSLSARERGPNWLYTYLKSFYIDKKRPFGANNLLIQDVAMPNVLAPLQGEVIAVRRHGASQEPDNFNLILLESGEMTQQQFDSALEDLITFLVYVGEPVKLIRYQLGVIVIIFLSMLAVLAYLLKRIYWRKIH
ncbi:MULTISPECIES: cytochrome c1 [Legionella]|uniref:Cytochrome c1 n=1 Tax=Legionella septentrionalis TaxID=2498109 RepID=A0A3S0VBE4_9GAMM|nr:MULTISPECIES: cytochrome c1 [Legionella]MCP0914571.1 cytochrome c1 [Legionella sp. 27cVA30]RUQ90034.1 cytochrome c1 [Legionella septentrionalis]RUQ95499.1 cytochrome c1 [Legionella septentrionalis]RUR11190.1 cytochrome c1 [Legionella septentrionalis]RUR14369.1 cytochrome c1 [Legionella septentrionalis]